MADASPTSRIRTCEACCTEYRVNPKFSRAQIAKSRFCSQACANTRDQSKAIKPIEAYLDGKTRFGMFTFLGEGDPLLGKYHPIRRARVQCDCGEIRHVQPANLRNGKHRSCGCTSAELSRQRFTTHGAYSTPEYRSWGAMMQRCHNPNSTSWGRYGGAGIVVCDEWHGPDGFHRFVEHVGPRPEGTTIDRIDGAKGYEPGNVRWATPTVQQNNLSSNVVLELNGVSKTQVEWSRHLGLSVNGVSERLRKGWTVERALSTPRKSA